MLAELIRIDYMGKDQDTGEIQYKESKIWINPKSIAYIDDKTEYQPSYAITFIGGHTEDSYCVYVKSIDPLIGAPARKDHKIPF